MLYDDAAAYSSYRQPPYPPGTDIPHLGGSPSHFGHRKLPPWRTPTTHYIVLYPQNGDRIVTIDPMYILLV